MTHTHTTIIVLPVSWNLNYRTMCSMPDGSHKMLGHVYAMWTIKNIISSLWNLMPVYFSFLLPDNVLFSWYHNCPLFVQVSWLVAWLLKSQMVHLMFVKYGSLHTSSISIFFLHQSNYPRFICSWLPMHEKGAVGRVAMGWSFMSDEFW